MISLNIPKKSRNNLLIGLKKFSLHSPRGMEGRGPHERTGRSERSEGFRHSTLQWAAPSIPTAPAGVCFHTAPHFKAGYFDSMGPNSNYLDSFCSAQEQPKPAMYKLEQAVVYGTPGSTTETFLWPNVSLRLKQTCLQRGILQNQAGTALVPSQEQKPIRYKQAVQLQKILTMVFFYILSCSKLGFQTLENCMSPRC